jgi:putative ABC transport system ATP-binding protein
VNELLVSIQSVSKVYGDHKVRALVDINLNVVRGEFVAIMGRSGCGKSTLLNLIGGIDRPSEGTISLVGQKISDLPDEKLTVFRRSKVGFIFQFFNLLNTLTVEENIALPLELIGNEAGLKARVKEIMETVGIYERANFYPAQLSGGEMQRTAIARALVHKPLLVIADEPTGNLDSENGTAILELLKDCCTNRKQTIIMATHSLEAAAYASRIIEIQDGHIVAEKQQCR